MPVNSRNIVLPLLEQGNRVFDIALLARDQCEVVAGPKRQELV